MEKFLNVRKNLRSAEHESTAKNLKAQKDLSVPQSPALINSAGSNSSTKGKHVAAKKVLVRSQGKKTVVKLSATEKEALDSILSTNLSVEVKTSIPTTISKDVHSPSNLPKTTATTPATMTMAQFRSNAALNKQRITAFSSFGSSVAELQKSPEKIKESPFYSPHKDSLTTAQAVNRIRREGSRRQLFGSSPRSDNRQVEETEEDIASSTPSELDPEPYILASSGRNISVCPRTPVKTPRKISPCGQLSPGKKMILFSPSKGLTHEYIKTAAQIVSESACKDVPGATDAADAHVMKSMQQGLGKRKAAFDKEDFKKRMEQIKSSKSLAQMSREKRLEISKPDDDFRVTSSPAYEKYDRLTTSELSLPPIYCKLEKLFDEIEMTVKLLNGQTCYFERLQPVIHERLQHTLTYEDLGRITAYFPEAYVFRIEKPASHLASPGMNHQSASKEHMAIYFRDDTKDSSCEPILISKLEVSDQLRRKRKFHMTLLKEVLGFHGEYLSSVNISLPEGPIYQWHPDFFSQFNFKLCEPVELPKFSKVHEPVSAETVLRRNNPDMSERVKNALEALTRQREMGGHTSKSPQLTPFKNSSDIKQWNLLSPALRQRAEENQAKSQARLVTRDPAITKRIRLLERLPEMSGIIWSYFKSEKMLPRSESDVLRAIRMSIRTILSEDDVKDHMALFTELFEGGFFSRYLSHQMYYWRISQDFQIKDVHSAIEEEMKRLKNL